VDRLGKKETQPCLRPDPTGVLKNAGIMPE